MLSITTLQLKKIHVLLTQLGLLDEKKELIRTLTNGRTESSRELTMYEATEFIKFLSKYDPCDAMRRKIFALAYEAGMIWGETTEDKKMNAVKLNKFLVEKGTVKKILSSQSHSELTKTIKQFSQVIKHKQESQAVKQTQDLLKELQIESSFNRHSNPIN